MKNPLIKFRIIKLSIIEFFILIIISAGTILLADSTDFSFVTLKKYNAKASSTLTESGKPASKYSAPNAFDGSEGTAWCEGKKDSGIGEYIESHFDPVLTDFIGILNGYGSSRYYYMANNRVKEYSLIVTTLSGKKIYKKGTLKDDTCSFPSAGGKMSPEDICMEQGCRHDDKKCIAECIVKVKNQCIMGAYEGGGEYISLGNTECVTGIKLKIESVYRGNKYNDTCIAEIKMIASIYRNPSKELPSCK